jgi:hypothetical protein
MKGPALECGDALGDQLAAAVHQAGQAQQIGWDMGGAGAATAMEETAIEQNNTDRNRAISPSSPMRSCSIPPMMSTYKNKGVIRAPRWTPT